MIGDIVKLRPPLLTFWLTVRLTVRLAAWPIVCLLALTPALAAAAALSHLSVRIVTGAEELTAGSYLELRIYEVGGRVRHLPLTNGESWPPDSTRVIPLNLSEPLDPRTVVRYSVYYRAGNALSPPWDIVSADVDQLAGGETSDRLASATLTGIIDHEGELSTPERAGSALHCKTDADCDDHRSCDGHERCAPQNGGADARGCVKGEPVVCPVNQLCTEAHGCVGLDSLRGHAPLPPAATSTPASTPPAQAH
jgi:hypothetical protein